MKALAQTSKTAILKEAVRAKTSLANLKNKVEERAGRTMDVALTLGGAAAAGYVAVKFPGQWYGLDKTVWLGGAFALLGLSGMAGRRASDPLLNLGNGMLAAWVYDATKAKVAANP